MDFQELLHGGRRVLLPFLLDAAGAAAILVIGRIAASILSRVTRHALQRAHTEETVTRFVASVVSVGVLVFAVVAALARFGIETTSFVAILGAAGIAVGLALQGALSNFSAGVMLLVFRPFRAGDFVEAAGVSGTVKEIRMFSTELASPDNVKIIVPNGAVFRAIIKNFSAYDTRRIDLVVGIGYGDAIGRAIEVLTEILKSDGRIIQDPEPQVFVKELAESSVNLLVRCWTRREDFWNVRCDLNSAIKENFDVQGIDLPYPQRVVHTVAEDAAH